MSVILDALKRVQDESRNPAAAHGGRQEFGLGDRQVGSGDTLVQRLAQENEPAAPARRAPLSTAARMALLVLCLVAVVVAGTWMFQPRLTSIGASDREPLLSGLTGAARPQTGAEPTAGGARPTTQQPTEDRSLFKDLVANPDEAASTTDSPSAATGQPAAPVPAAQEQPTERAVADVPAWRPPTGQRDLSDLSANLPPAGNDVAPTRESSQPVDGYIDLTTDFRGPESPAAGATDADVIVSDGAGARLPRELVDPGVRAAFDDGVRMQKAGDLVGAEGAYKRALKFDPHNSKVNANLGVLYESTDRLPLAESHLRRAIAVDPDSPNAHNNLGVVLYRMGNYDGALIEFNRTVTLDPDRLDAYTNKGLIFTRWGRHEDAERAFLQVLARDPANALAHYNLGLVYEETGQIDRALDHYYEFLRIGGVDHPEISNYLGEHLPWLEARSGGTDR